MGVMEEQLLPALSQIPPPREHFSPCDRQWWPGHSHASFALLFLCPLALLFFSCQEERLESKDYQQAGSTQAALLRGAGGKDPGYYAKEWLSVHSETAPNRRSPEEAVAELE